MKYRIIYVKTYSGIDYYVAQYKRWWWIFWRVIDCRVLSRDQALSIIQKHSGNTYDRDIQAAKNIKKFALRNYVSRTDTKNRNELPTLVGVMTCEAKKNGSSRTPTTFFS